MVTVYFSKPGSRFEMRLTDGYIREQQQPKWLQSPPWSDLPPEKGMAELLYSHNKGLHYPPDWPYRHEVVQAWVIGENAWPKKQIPDPIKGIVEEDQRDDYRIVIIALGEESEDKRYSAQISSSIYSAGIQLKKHEDKKGFDASGIKLLEVLADENERNCLPTCGILEDLRVPYSFRGDVRS